MGRRIRLVSILAIAIPAAGCAGWERWKIWEEAGLEPYEEPESRPSREVEPDPEPLSLPPREEGDGQVFRWNLDITFWAPAADGRVAGEGATDSASGSPRAWGGGLSLEALGDPYYFHFETAAQSLPSDLDLDGGGFLTNSRTEYHHLDLAFGARVLEIPSAEGEGEAAPGVPLRRPALRVDPFVGMRRSVFVVSEDFLGVFPTNRHGHRWLDAVAGLRVESQLSKDFVLRLRGDTLVAGRSEHAWRATATIVFGTGSARVAFGWQCLSMDFETGSGLGLVRYDVFLSGPFVSLELLL